MADLVVAAQHSLRRAWRARRRVGRGLALILGTTLLFWPRGAVDSAPVPICQPPEGVDCQTSTPDSALRAEPGGVWVAVGPVEVAVHALNEGWALYRSLDGEQPAPIDAAAVPLPDGDTTIGDLDGVTGPRRALLALTHHTVRDGETLEKIAGRYGIDVPTLAQANQLRPEATLAVGAELLVPPVVGVVHRVQPGETVAMLAARYGSDLAKVVRVNGLPPSYTIVVGQLLVFPGGKLSPNAPAEDWPPGDAPAPRNVQAPGQPTALADLVEVPAPLPRPPGATPQRAAFIMDAAEAARLSQRQTGVPASVTIAQAILESDWGASRLSAEHKNYFGIKALDRPGTAGVVWMDTWEVSGGKSIISHEPFRAYATAADSFVDHGQFFLQNRRYAAAMAARNDPKQFAIEINRAGYATDPDYAAKLISLMDRYNLYAYDLK